VSASGDTPANGAPPGTAETTQRLDDPTAPPPAQATAPAAPATPSPGGQVAETATRYVLDREIGRGGMGRVFAGRDLRLQRPVAIKVLREKDGAGEGGGQRAAAAGALAARFEREIRLAARLQHPGVVPVYDAGFWPNGEPFLVMKLVLGQSLTRVIRDAESLEDRLALLPLVIAAADAVSYAHDQGIVHRDLKPANILVGAFGETVVVDWGLGKEVGAAAAAAGAAAGAAGATAPAGGAAAGDTGAGAVMGTPGYMAPEQAAGHAVDARTDVHGLGAILYHVLSGTAPGPSSEPTGPGARAPAAAPRAPEPLAALEPRVPADLLAIVSKAMSPSPRGRYPSAFELAEDLKRFQAGQLVAARRYSPAARAARWLARHPFVAVAAAAAIAAAVAAHWLG
jgi:serine/threonine protein kinase